MKNIEKYKEDILNLPQANITCCANRLSYAEDCTKKTCAECKKTVLKWLLEEYKETILNEAEKNYLSAVIEPFRDKVKYISKIGTEQFILIVTKDGNNCCLPYFTDEKKKYEGMVSYREYKLEELGL